MMWRAIQVGHTLIVNVAWYAFFLHQLQVDMLSWVINHLLKVILQTAKEWSIDGRVLPAALQEDIPADK